MEFENDGSRKKKQIQPTEVEEFISAALAPNSPQTSVLFHRKSHFKLRLIVFRKETDFSLMN
jgi:hypothetical protein